MIDCYRLKLENDVLVFLGFSGKDAELRCKELHDALVAVGAHSSTNVFLSFKKDQFDLEQVKELCEPTLLTDDHLIIVQQCENSTECSILVRQRNGDGIEVSGNM